MKQLIEGNIALCNGAIDAGLDAYFGYPITPQNEIPTYLSKKND
jgi:2-oxoglutarate ferredoxin oxidoreductase subunit alpha